MKTIYTILVAILLTATVFAQAPEKMSYQAVIRNSTDQLVTSQDIGMQISILQGTSTGTVIYVETQSATTNANGLVSIEIGTGATTDDFSAIDWANDVYFIKTETDPTTAGGTSYTITGVSQLLSVSYALHAKTAETVTGTITETDPLFTTSEANNIIATDITNLSNLSNVNTGDQNLSEVSAISNFVNTQLKNVTNPTDAQDAATKAYVDEMLIQAGVYTFKDYDGNVYNTIEIGTQVWMSENLKVTHYPNGDLIPLVTYNTTWANLADNNTDDAMSYYNNNASNEADTYGALYTYAAAIGDDWARDLTTNQGVCPDGWHLPTDAEWTTLTDYLGTDAGSKLAGNATLWTDGNLDQNANFDETGFSAFPSGYRSSYSGTFSGVGNYGYWWSSTEYSSSIAYYCSLYYNNANASRSLNDKSLGHCVRCVRD